MKKIKFGLVLLLAIGSLTGCDNKHEIIQVLSRTDLVFDDINITLDDGYWVKDYSIDYENMEVTLRLTK